MLQLFGLIAGILVVIAYIPYIQDILRGKTKPERASWFIWFILGGILFITQVAKGATNSLWLSGTENLGILIVFFLSLKYGIGGLTKVDIMGLAAAAFGLFMWFTTKEAAVALYIVLTINLIATLLTIHKTFKYPKSETLLTWLLAGIGGIFAILSVGTWDLVILSYPIYHTIINFSVVITILLAERKIRRKRNRNMGE